MGNMILIKDRHESGSLFIVGTRTNMSGKYDTYKGSTRSSVTNQEFSCTRGNYDTYKGSTRFVAIHSNISYDFGNYDTYKGSIP